MKRGLLLYVVAASIIAIAAGLLGSGPRAIRPPGPSVPVPIPPAPDWPAATLPRSGACTLLGLATRNAKPVTARIEVRAARAASFEGIPSFLPPGGGPLTASESGDGHFEFPGLPPGRYEVRATAPGGASGCAFADLPSDGSLAQVVVEIAGGPHTLSGVAVFADGTPFHGGIGARPLGPRPDAMPFPPEVPAFQPTGEDGGFALTGLEPGLHVLVFCGEGHDPSEGPCVTLPAPGPIRAVVDGEGQTIAGRVVDAAGGTPVAGAEVTVLRWRWHLDEGPLPVTATVTDADGRFRLRAWTREAAPSGRFARRASERYLRVRAEACAPWQWPLPADPSSIPVRLSREVVVRGRVVLASNGAAIAGVPILLRGQGVAVSAEDGSFEVRGLPDEAFHLLAFGNGWAATGLASDERRRSTMLVRPRAGGTILRDLPVEPAAALAVRVTDRAGRPAPGAVVTARPEHLGRLVPSPPAARCGADGLALVSRLGPGVDYLVTANTPGRPASAPVSVVAGRDAEIDLRLPPIRRLRIRVTEEESGVPLSGANVWIARTTGDIGYAFVPHARAVTDADGTCEISCAMPVAPPGGWPVRDGVHLLVEAWHPASASRGDHWLKSEAGGLEEVTIALPRRPPGSLGIAGRVERSGGGEVSDGMALLQDANRGDVIDSAPIEVGGLFRFDRVAPGEYRVTARASTGGVPCDGGPLACRAGDTDVRLLLSSDVEGDARAFLLRVLGPDGLPVAVATAGVDPPGANSLCGTLLDGEYRGAIPVAGSYVEVTRARDAAGTLLGAALAGPLAGGEREFTVSIPKAYRIEGTVRDEAGRGVEGVDLTAYPAAPGASQYRSHGDSETDPTGRFLIDGLGDMGYRLEFRHSEDYVQAEQVTVVAGATDVAITLRPAAEVVVLVLDPQGGPVEGAGVELRLTEPRDRRQWFLERTGPDGRVRFRPGLEADRFVAEVDRPRTREDLFPRVLRRDGAGSGEIVLRFGEGWTLSGVARDGEGNRLADSRIFARSRERGWIEAGRTGDAGRFMLEGLPPGDVELRAGSVDDPPPGAPAHCSVACGAENVEITFDTGAAVVVRIADWPAERSGIGVLTREGGAARGHRASVTSSGRARYVGLTPGATYAFHLENPPPGTVLYLTGLAPSDREVRAALGVDHPITGRVVFPAAYEHHPFPREEVEVTGPGFAVRSEILEDTTFRVTGVPQGRFTLTVLVYAGDGPWGAEMPVDAGSEVEVVLRRQD